MQMEYNRKHGITPETVRKAVRDVIEATKVAEEEEIYSVNAVEKALQKEDAEDIIKKMANEMKQAAADLQFERAAELRDRINELKERL